MRSLICVKNELTDGAPEGHYGDVKKELTKHIFLRMGIA